MKKLIPLFLFIALLLNALAAEAARLSLTPKSLPSIKSTISANSLDFTFVGGNSADGYQFDATGREIILAWNTDDDTAYTFTVVSTVDENGRTGDITSYSLGFGEVSGVGPFPLKGWAQTNGKININSNNDAVKFAVLRLAR